MPDPWKRRSGGRKERCSVCGRLRRVYALVRAGGGWVCAAHTAPGEDVVVTSRAG